MKRQQREGLCLSEGKDRCRYLLFHMEPGKGPVEKGLLFQIISGVFLILNIGFIILFVLTMIPFIFFCLQLLNAFAFSCSV